MSWIFMSKSISLQEMLLLFDESAVILNWAFFSMLVCKCVKARDLSEIHSVGLLT